MKALKKGREKSIKDSSASKESGKRSVVAKSNLEVSDEPASKRPRGSRELRGILR